MNTLFRKELRENFRVGIIAVIIFTLMLAATGISYGEIIKHVALGTGWNQNDWDKLQPLTSLMFLMKTAWLCGIFGTILGWLQIYNERHTDLRAFLVHRPASYNQIFLSKVLAGLVIYSLGAGLPLACFIIWIRTPGHIAAPFEWRILWPPFAFVLMGIVWYFAGMLTSLRRARWYASRTFGLGVAILASGAAVGAVWLSWQVLLALVLCSGLVGIAAWGSFQTHGHYEGQPSIGKLALNTSMMAGALVIIVLASILTANLIPGLSTTSYASYLMSKDGTIYKQTYHWDKPPEIVDLSGKPLLNTHTDRPVPIDEFLQGVAPTFYLALDSGDKKGPNPAAEKALTFWHATSDTLWFYWTRYGRLAGYSIATRRLIGSIGPDGFSPSLSVRGEQFKFPGQHHPLFPATTLRTTSGVYVIDLENRGANRIFTAPKGDRVTAATDISFNNREWAHTAVVTKQQIYVVRFDGKEAWRGPLEPAHPDYTTVGVSLLEATNQVAVWVGPSEKANRKAKWQLPTYVRWLASDQQIVKTAKLAPLRPRTDDQARDMLMSVLMPPAVFALMPVIIPDAWLDGMLWKPLLASLATAAFTFVPIGWWLGRRYSFSISSQVGWAVFYLIGGLPAFLAFLSVQEWPARERCPACNALRTVDRRHCGHCGAEFPQPKQDGTEIFEPLVTA